MIEIKIKEDCVIEDNVCFTGEKGSGIILGLSETEIVITDNICGKVKYISWVE